MHIRKYIREHHGQSFESLCTYRVGETKFFLIQDKYSSWPETDGVIILQYETQNSFYTSLSFCLKWKVLQKLNNEKSRGGNKRSFRGCEMTNGGKWTNNCEDITRISVPLKIDNWPIPVQCGVNQLKTDSVLCEAKRSPRAGLTARKLVWPVPQSRAY